MEMETKTEERSLEHEMKMTKIVLDAVKKELGGWGNDFSKNFFIAVDGIDWELISAGEHPAVRATFMKVYGQLSVVKLHEKINNTMRNEVNRGNL